MTRLQITYHFHTFLQTYPISLASPHLENPNEELQIVLGLPPYQEKYQGESPLDVIFKEKEQTKEKDIGTN